MAKAGGNARDRERFGSGIINRFYPRIAKDDALWGCPPEIQLLLAIDAGYTYFDGYPELLRRVGLTALSLSWNSANRDEHIFSVTRVEAEAMGREDRAAKFLANYRQGYIELEQELRTPTLAEHPRVLGMGASTNDWNFVYVTGVSKEGRFDDSRIGIENASGGHEVLGRQQDAERILAMNPDILLIGGQTPLKFSNDPRTARNARRAREPGLPRPA